MRQGLSLAAEVGQVMREFRRSGFARSFCTIQSPPSDLTPSGGIGPLDQYTDVPGLVHIPCMDAPPTDKGVKGASYATSVESESDRKVLLDNYYPQLSSDTNWGDIGWIAMIDSTDEGDAQVVYRLVGAECDSQRTQTHLFLERVQV